MIKLSRLTGLIAFSAILVGCGPVHGPNDERHRIRFDEVHKPAFRRCQAAVDRAYAGMNNLKYRSSHLVGYEDWTTMNESLASALSARQNRNYPSCVANAQEVTRYVARDLAYIRWQSHQTVRLAKPSRQTAKVVNNHPAKRLAKKKQSPGFTKTLLKTKLVKQDKKHRAKHS